MNTLRFKIISAIVIAVFALSLANTQVVLADDVNPPAETPTETAPPEGGTEPSEGETSTLLEVLAQAPAGTEVVVTDAATGQPLPLATQAAANALATADPIWCPAGYFPGDAECLDNGGAGYASLADLLAALASDPSTYAGPGTIYLEAGQLVDTSDVLIDQSVLGLTDLIVQGGWNGVIDSSAWAIDPTTPSIFNGISLWITNSSTDYWNGNIALNDLVFVDAPGTALIVMGTGDIAVSNVDVSKADGSGALLVTTGTYTDGTGEVTVSESSFVENAAGGLIVDTYGDVTLNTVAAVGNAGSGLELYTTGNVTLNAVTAAGNTYDGVYIWAGEEVWVEDSQFIGNGRQIVVENEYVEDVPGDHYYRNYYYGANPVGSGLEVRPYDAMTIADLIITLSGNEAVGNYLYGVYVHAPAGTLSITGDYYAQNGSIYVEEYGYEYRYNWNIDDYMYWYTSDNYRAYPLGGGLFASAGQIALDDVGIYANIGSGAYLSAGTGGVSVRQSSFYETGGPDISHYTQSCYREDCDWYNSDAWERVEGSGLSIESSGLVWLEDVIASDNGINGAYVRGDNALYVKDSYFDDNGSISYYYHLWSQGADFYSNEQWEAEGTGLYAIMRGAITLDSVNASHNFLSGVELYREGLQDNTSILYSSFVDNGGYYEYQQTSSNGSTYEEYRHEWGYSGYGLFVATAGSVTLTEVIANENYGVGAAVWYAQQALVTGGQFNANRGEFEEQQYWDSSSPETGYQYSWHYFQGQVGYGLVLADVQAGVVTDVQAIANAGYGLGVGMSGGLLTFDGGGEPAGLTLNVFGGTFSGNAGHLYSRWEYELEGPASNYYEFGYQTFLPGAGIGVIWSPGAQISLTDVTAVENAVAGVLLDDSFSLLAVSGGSFHNNSSFYEEYSHYNDGGIEEEAYQYTYLGDGIVTGSEFYYVGEEIIGFGSPLALMAEPSTASVTIIDSTANGNQRSGFHLEGGQTAFLYNVTAFENGQSGAEIVAFGQPVTIQCSTLSANASYGVEAYLGGGILSLLGVTTVGNGVQEVYVQDGVVVYGPCVPVTEEPADTTAPAAPRPLPYQYVRLPAIGGGAGLNCTQYGGTVVELPNRNRVILPCPILDEVKLREIPLEQLPAPLTGGTFLASMEARVLRDGQELDKLDSRMVVAFHLTEDQLKQKPNLAILYWDKDANDKKGAWVELPARVLVDGVDQTFPLHDPFDGKKTYVGAHLTDAGYFEVEVNFTGLFVLIQK